MSKLGIKQKPAIVKVKDEARAKEILAMFNSNNGWQVIIGIEPQEKEDISDVERLPNPPKPLISQKVDRNAPCPCGSGKKSKKMLLFKLA
jgi:SWIM/SEC-C metal-binding protein